MEYLMTYGWAILIISIVLAALFQLGIFNTAAFVPKAPPGSCQVYDFGGSRDLGGLCHNEFPEFVLSSKGVGDFVVVNGSNAASSPLNIVNSITITAWIYINGQPYHDIVDKEGQYGLKIDYNNAPHSCYPSNYPGLCIEWDTNGDWVGPGFAIPNASFRQWIFVAATINGSTNTKYWYANGKEIGSRVVSQGLAYSNSEFTIGAISPGYTGYGDAEWFNGSIANVQIYNASLSQNAIAALYSEGIGGAPIDLQNLVAWYQLNGNANDYSGSMLNGRIYNESFTESWTNTYPLP